MHISICCAASTVLGKRGSSSDNRGHQSNKRERVDANGGGGALFDLNVPAEVVDKIWNFIIWWVMAHSFELYSWLKLPHQHKGEILFFFAALPP
jgi:hypothetical protein